MADPRFPRPSDDFFDYLIEKITPEAILAYQTSEKTQQHATELFKKEGECKLRSEEAAELEQVRYAERLISALKTRALEALNRS